MKFANPSGTYMEKYSNYPKSGGTGAQQNWSIWPIEGGRIEVSSEAACIHLL